MSDFIDHLQFVPVPSRGGKRPPDGEHRPGGLGTRTFSDRLETLGWTGRIEDMAFEKDVPEKRIMEAYAMGVADAILSAWDRDRFPIVLSTVSFGTLGAVDAYAPDTGLLWISPRVDYRTPSLLRRPPLDRRTLALATGRAKRDELAAQPGLLPAERIVFVGGWRSDEKETRELAEDGATVLGRERLDDVDEAIEAVGADRWIVHLDVSALAGDRVPAADDRDPEGFDPDAVVEALDAALAERDVRSVTLARYDLNRDDGETSLACLTELIDRVVLIAGGVPNPKKRTEARSVSRTES